MHPTLTDYGRFVKRIDSDMAAAGIAPSELAMLDHLCYRVETNERYEELKSAFTKSEEYVGEAVVGGRSISTFEFRQPLVAGNWAIPYLELPAPKQGSSYPEGLEHAEFVVIGSLEKFQNRHSDLTFETRGMSKQLNQELGLQLGSVAVKFHEQPLGSIVRIEQRMGL